MKDTLIDVLSVIGTLGFIIFGLALAFVFHTVIIGFIITIMTLLLGVIGLGFVGFILYYIFINIKQTLKKML